MTFNKYSKYYDMLYRDKNYQAEVAYVDSLISEFAASSKTILDLGCGTGRHDILLAEKGYLVTGVDISEEMLAVAQSQALAFNLQPLPVNYIQGDIRTIRLDRTFDVIISLFHVMSYQITNVDLSAAFSTVKAHLKPGGLYIFDCWYGPAVLTLQPVTRVKRLEDEAIEVTRIAEPVMHSHENVVDVNYQVFIKDKANGRIDELREKHCMRYLFNPEIEHLIAEAGLSVIKSLEWMTDAPPGYGSWSACFLARR